ncbi:MAG TPA: hypothetical protein VM735_11875 [Candidatus Kapabacteria bacterium]|nr:hypothetical protein [Candidatus Kapabacteria bacterium]
MRIFAIVVVCGLMIAAHEGTRAAESTGRPFKDAADQKAWLENMVVYHRFTAEEISAASGLSQGEAEKLAKESQGIPKPQRAGEPLRVLPYPGGRHPRIGFLDGAIDPQRETKLSIFLPWDATSYVVADVPEAIWSNLGLTYLAHKHVETIWTKQGIELPRLEWTPRANGDYRCERTMPNGIKFGTLARSTPEAVLMKMWLSNGTSQALSEMRVQNCVMLKGAEDFAAQTDSNKVLEGAFSACRSKSGDRWVITAWKPLHRAWANPPVPCLHSDPKIPDAKPGETVTTHGLISFFEGKDIQAEFKRLESNWNQWMNF